MGMAFNNELDHCKVWIFKNWIVFYVKTVGSGIGSGSRSAGSGLDVGPIRLHSYITHDKHWQYRTTNSPEEFQLLTREEAKVAKTQIWNDDLHYTFCKDTYSMDSGDCVHHPGSGPHRSRRHPTVRLAHSLHVQNTGSIPSFQFLTSQHEKNIGSSVEGTNEKGFFW